MEADLVAVVGGGLRFYRLAFPMAIAVLRQERRYPRFARARRCGNRFNRSA